MLVFLQDSAGGPEEAVGENSGITDFRDTLTTTRAWLQSVFVESMLQSLHPSSVRFTYKREIQVSCGAVSKFSGL